MNYGFLLLFFLISCQDINSNTFDVQQYGPTTISGSSNFQTAFPIIKTRCATCHTHSGWSAYTTEEAWISTGYVIAQNPNASSLVTRIKNYGPSGDMPLNAGALPQAEFDAIVNWVQNITP